MNYSAFPNSCDYSQYVKERFCLVPRVGYHLLAGLVGLPMIPPPIRNAYAHIRLEPRLHSGGLHSQTIANLQAYHDTLPEPAFALFARCLWLTRQDLRISARLVDVEVVAVEFGCTYIYAVVLCAIHIVLRNIGYKHRVAEHYSVVFVGFLQNGSGRADCIVFNNHNGVVADNLCGRGAILRPSRGKAKQPHKQQEYRYPYCYTYYICQSLAHFYSYPIGGTIAATALSHSACSLSASSCVITR